jgi:hypothetical protein
LDYYDVKYISPDTVLYQGEPNTATHFWNVGTNATTDFPGQIQGHHDIEYDPFNKTFLTLQNYVRDVNGTKYLFDKIEEFTAASDVVWTWDAYDHIPLSEQSIFNITTVVNGETVVDFTHANSLEWDYNDSIIYLNCRHTNTFYKIDENTGNVIWACGEFGNFTLLNGQGNEVRSLWYGCHDVRQVEPDVLSCLTMISIT